MDRAILLTGLAIFLARIVDVALGTLRTINIVHGRTTTAFLLGFVEISIWLAVISTVIEKIREVPALGFFYALGFAAGNTVGITIEKWIAAGFIILRVISRETHQRLATAIRQAGFTVTTFNGQGMAGPVVELYIVCRRRNIKNILRMVNEIEPGAFYTMEQARVVSKLYRPAMQPATGWRAILKKK